MKTLLQMEMYYVIEYPPTCRFLKNNQRDPTTVGVYSSLHIILAFFFNTG
jgi:hypothetical protein